MSWSLFFQCFCFNKGKFPWSVIIALWSPLTIHNSYEYWPLVIRDNFRLFMISNHIWTLWTLIVNDQWSYSDHAWSVLIGASYCDTYQKYIPRGFSNYGGAGRAGYPFHQNYSKRIFQLWWGGWAGQRAAPSIRIYCKRIFQLWWGGRASYFECISLGLSSGQPWIKYQPSIPYHTRIII